MLPCLSPDDAGELAERFDFSGGQIENAARKCTVEQVLSGIEPDLKALIAFCEEELRGQDADFRIGFRV
jgi:hypothetical protein